MLNGNADGPDTKLPIISNNNGSNGAGNGNSGHISSPQQNTMGGGRLQFFKGKGQKRKLIDKINSAYISFIRYLAWDTELHCAGT